MAHEIITLETLALEIARLRGELATWKALAIKQDRLGTAQMQAVNSGATTGKIAQIATNTANITALQQIVSGMFRVVKVAELPVTGEPQTMYLVPQTDGETLNYCNEYLWIDNAWELVGTTGAMANNGELQIIVNGVTVGTFTANQATDSTASITVPTDTSQLTNGAGYVDATALATALASKQDSLSLTQLAAVNSGITSADVAQIGTNTTAIAGKQDALTTSQLAAVNSGITSADVAQIGTNTGNIATNSAAIVSLQGSKQNTLSAAQLLAVNSGITSSLVTQIGTNQSDITTLNTALGQSLTPSADNTYSLGGASFRYANVYAVTFTGDLTGTASKAIADEDGTSIKTGYVNVAGNQTVSGDKSWTGSNTFNSILPNATNTYSLGSSSYQWSSVYAQTYYYNGAAWGLDKENVWSANQTINKHGSSIIFKSNNVNKGTIQNVDSSAITFTDKNNKSLCYIQQLVNSASRTLINFHVENTYKNGALSTDSDATLIQSGWIFGQLWDGRSYYDFSGGSYNDIYPLNVNGVNSNLGTPTNKWKTLNGVNPGALSLPSRAYNDSIALDTTDWDYAGNGFVLSMTDNNGNYIPGWIVIVAEDVGDVSDYIKIRLTSYTRSPGLDFTTLYTGSQYNIKACFPTAGLGYLVLKLTNGASCIKYARYHPCLGNV